MSSPMIQGIISLVVSKNGFGESSQGAGNNAPQMHQRLLCESRCHVVGWGWLARGAATHPSCSEQSGRGLPSGIALNCCVMPWSHNCNSMSQLLTLLEFIHYRYWKSTSVWFFLCSHSYRGYVPTTKSSNNPNDPQ